MVIDEFAKLRLRDNAVRPRSPEVQLGAYERERAGPGTHQNRTLTDGAASGVYLNVLLPAFRQAWRQGIQCKKQRAQRAACNVQHDSSSSGARRRSAAQRSDAMSRTIEPVPPRMGMTISCSK
jgi:hypothetical protein